MTSLVTGGAGFIGSHVARKLLKLGHQVLVLDDLSGGSRRNLPEGVRFIHGCCSDTELVNAVFRECHIDYVYHLAAYAAEGMSHFVRRFNYQNNLVSSANLVNAAVLHGVKCFVFTSSIAVYGRGKTPMVEDMTPQPEDPYGISKYAVELDLRAAADMFGLRYVIFRPHNVFGENQNLADPYRNAVGIFMNRVMRGEPIVIFGDGMQTRAFSYVEDIAEIIAQSASEERMYDETYNIGSEHKSTVLELAQAIAQVAGGAEITFTASRNEVTHAYASHQKLRQVVPLIETPLEEGLKRMWSWARRVGPVERTPLITPEITLGLPQVWRQ